MWWTAIIETIKEFLGLSKKIADNQGQKIPMREEAIKGKSEKKGQRFANQKDEIAEEGIKDDKIPKVEFFRHKMTFTMFRHAKKQVDRLIDSGNQITSIGIEARQRKDRKGKNILKEYLVIRYLEGKCPQEYLVACK